MHTHVTGLSVEAPHYADTLNVYVAAHTLTHENLQVWEHITILLNCMNCIIIAYE